MDVKNEFMNVWIDEEIYMEWPFVVMQLGKDNLVFKLSWESLYGLKKAPRALDTKIDEYFKDIIQ